MKKSSIKIEDEITKEIIKRLTLAKKGFTIENIDIVYINEEIAKHLKKQNLK
ncbi:MAG: hypothetical protein JKX98_06855 [Alcanivoracaceae bacterium]|nr:hypothetical protein [Alcanivoracaceae bacterium]